MPETHERLLDHVRTRQVIVCVGSGGVGKTTIAAAIGLQAAYMGRTACVLTIDPARRLANAMGLNALANSPSRIDEARFDEAGVPRPSGRLFAAMLDTKRTWDDLVYRFAPTRDQARRILANKYHRNISTTAAGSQDFMAMEKLYELHETGAYELLVLDTPPTRHALDFLDAPKRMIDFMDDRLLRFLMMPTQMGKFGLGMLTSSTAMMFAMLQRMTGFEVLSDIADYVSSFSGMHAGFKERAQRVEEYLRSARTIFTLVAAPNPETVDEAIFFFRKLKSVGMPFGGFVFNRVKTSAIVTPEAAAEWQALQADQTKLTPDRDLAARLIDNFSAHQAMARVHAAHLKRLTAECPGSYFRCSVPAFDTDVRDLRGLARMNEFLFSGTS